METTTALTLVPVQYQDIVTMSENYIYKTYYIYV